MKCHKCGKTIYALYWHAAYGDHPTNMKYCPTCDVIYTVSLKERGTKP